MKWILFQELYPSAPGSPDFSLDLPPGTEYEVDGPVELIITMENPADAPGVTVSELQIEACIKPEGNASHKHCINRDRKTYSYSEYSASDNEGSQRKFRDNHNFHDFFEMDML